RSWEGGVFRPDLRRLSRSRGLGRRLLDFLDRLRIQCWVYAVPVLRRHASLRGRLWSGHNTLLDAVESGDARAAREVVAAYNRHALAQVGADGAVPRPEEDTEGE
ncbi:hypothetical protein ABZ686_31840, partial [Streptomyces sp. NPDC006992]